MSVRTAVGASLLVALGALPPPALAQPAPVRSPFVRAAPPLPAPATGREGRPPGPGPLGPALPGAGGLASGSFGPESATYLGYPVSAFVHAGTAGERLHIRVEAEGDIFLCVAGLESLAAALDGGGGPRDMAGNCVGSRDSRTTSFSTVLPSDGDVAVAVVFLDGVADSVGTYRLETVTAGGHVVPIADASPVTGVLGAEDEDEAGRPVAAHFVAGQAGDRLSVTVTSRSFVPYAEVGTGSGPGYTPLVGGEADSAGAIRLQLVLPRTGVYSVLLGDYRGDYKGTGLGEYTVGVERAPARPWAEVYPGGGDPDGRYALLVGVADYPGLGPSYAQGDLVGPREDVQTMRTLLVDTYGFRPEDVVVIEDAEATREGVIEAVRRHLGQSGPDGTAVLYYSGHGVQVPTAALNAEPDGQDESLALWGPGGDVATLLDYEVGALLNGLDSGRTVVVLDNCFSGTGTRGASGDFAVRRLDYEDVAGYVAAAGDPVADRPAAAYRTAEPERHVLLSASRSDQPSLEMDGLGGLPGRRGVFTHFLAAALREAGPEATFESVVASVRPRVMGATREVMAGEVGGPPQQPQVEGAQRAMSVAETLGPRP